MRKLKCFNFNFKMKRKEKNLKFFLVLYKVIQNLNNFNKTITSW